MGRQFVKIASKQMEAKIFKLGDWVKTSDILGSEILGRVVGVWQPPRGSRAIYYLVPMNNGIPLRRFNYSDTIDNPCTYYVRESAQLDLLVGAFTYLEAAKKPQSRCTVCHPTR